jgi:hypothetical protein
MRISTINGRVSVTTPEGQTLPYERFTITLNPDGSRTLRALSVSPNGGLIRDVNANVSADWVSRSGTSRLFLDGELQGVVAKISDGETIHSSVWPGHGAPDLKTFPAPAKFSLGFHPIADEAWKMALIAPRDGRQQLVTHTCSPRWNGKTIEHGETVTSEVEYLGEETRPVCGRPETTRMYLWHTPFGRLMKVWVLGEHNIFSRMEVLEAPNAGTVYELVALEHEIW